MLVIKILHDYVAGTSFNYFDYYRLEPHLFPHLLHTLIVTGLSFIMPVLVAHKVVISLYALLLPVSVFTFLSVIGRRQTVFGYASVLTVKTVK